MRKKLADPNKAGGGDNHGVYCYWFSWSCLPMQFVYDFGKCWRVESRVFFEQVLEHCV